MDTVTYPDASLKKQLTRWVFQKIDITENPELAKALKVTAVPVAIAITPEGLELARLANFVPPQEFREWLEKILPGNP